MTVIDRTTGCLVRLAPDECGFGYRSSRFKGADRDRFLVTGVTFRLRPGRPQTAYPDIARWLDEAACRSPTLSDVRTAVLAVRRRKGMVLDPADVDSRSVGSFFMNPVVSVERAAELVARDTETGGPPRFATADGRVKVPAAWLIERSGCPRGSRDGRVRISSKHPLAVVNAAGATAREIIDFAALIKRRVIDAWGVWLQSEPVFLGCEGDEAAVFLGKAGE